MNNSETREPNKNRSGLYWLVGLSAATVLFIVLWIFGDVRYFSNDDTSILRSFVTSTTPMTFHLCLHPLLCYPLAWLGTIAPKIAWFSWMQLVFLWFSGAVMVKNVFACFDRRGQWWFGALAGITLLVCFGMYYCGRITFTQTAAMLGAAAVTQVFGINWRNASNRQIILGLLLCLLLNVLAYALRQITAFPIFIFCILAGLWVGLEYYWKKPERNPKALISCAIISLLVVGGLSMLREIEIDQKDMRNYLHWDKASSVVMDYVGLKDLPEDFLTKIGWTASEPALVDKWYFMDKSISTGALEEIAAYHLENHNLTMVDKLQMGWNQLKVFASKEPIAMRSIWLLCGVYILCALGLLLNGRTTKLKWLALIGGLLLAAALLYYLAIKGRMPLRAVITAILPAAAYGFCLLPICIPDKGTITKDTILALAACGCVALGLWYAIPAAQSLEKMPVSKMDDAPEAYSSLDSYALANPDILVIYDETLVGDTRLFPDFSEGIPTNLIFWGGWGYHSPQYIETLKAFDIKMDEIDASLFLRVDVELARGIVEPGPDTLRSYLRERFGENVDYALNNEYGGIHTFYFYE